MASIKVVHSSYPQGEVDVEGETIKEVITAFRRSELHRNCNHAIVCHNGTFIPKATWATTAVQNGDIIRLGGYFLHCWQSMKL